MEYEKGGVKYCKLEALIFAYLLIVTALYVHDISNLQVLAACSLIVLPIKVISTWFKVADIYISARIKGDSADLIVSLGNKGFKPKSVGIGEYIFATDLLLFPNSWCMVKSDGSENILIGTRPLIEELNAGLVHTQLIEKSEINNIKILVEVAK